MFQIYNLRYHCIRIITVREESNKPVESIFKLNQTNKEKEQEMNRIAPKQSTRPGGNQDAVFFFYQFNFLFYSSIFNFFFLANILLFFFNFSFFIPSFLIYLFLANSL